MGQYYNFVALNSGKKTCSNKDKIRASLKPWDFNNGAKLMEFSYMKNNFIGTIESLINIDNGDGRLAGCPIVFAGDYAENEPNTYMGNKINLHFLAEEMGLDVKPKIAPEPKHFRYIINKTKGVYYDTNRCKPINTKWCPKSDGWYINPLPLLCADGNGKGGGDYFGKNQRMVGSWKRNVVVVSDNKPEGYREVFYQFAMED